MEEVSEYIGHNISYRADIHRYLENGMKTGAPSPMRLTRNEYDRELSKNQKFIREKRITEYVNKETKLDKNSQKAYSLIFIQCTNHMQSTMDMHEDYLRMRGEYGVFLLVGAIKRLNFKF